MHIEAVALWPVALASSSRWASPGALAALAMHALQRLIRAGAGDGNRTPDNLPARNKVTPAKQA